MPFIISCSILLILCNLVKDRGGHPTFWNVATGVSGEVRKKPGAGDDGYLEKYIIYCTGYSLQ